MKKFRRRFRLTIGLIMFLAGLAVGMWYLYHVAPILAIFVVVILAIALIWFTMQVIAAAAVAWVIIRSFWAILLPGRYNR